MRVLLINPKSKSGGAKREECCTGPEDSPVLPSQILLCTEYLRRQGWQVDFIDQQVDDITIQYQDYDVIVGWAATGVDELDYDMIPLKEASEVGVRTILILQGAPLLDMEAMIKYPYLDATIKEPEREITLDKLLAAWDDGGSIDFPGIVYRENNRLVDTGTAPFASSWEHLGSAVSVLNPINLSRYSYGLVLGSKGCPYSCTYCKFARTPVRCRKPEDVAEEMVFISRRKLKVLLLNQEFLVDGVWAEQLCDELTGSGVDWRTLTRADHITLKTAKMLKRAGCTCVVVGAETADEGILGSIHKGCTVERVVEGAKICHSIGLGCHFTFMVGFPWDTWRTVKMSSVMMEALNPATYSVQALFPYRGTILYKEMQEMGIFSGEVPLEAYCHNISTEPMFHGLHLTKQDISIARNSLQSKVRSTKK